MGGVHQEERTSGESAPSSVVSRDTRTTGRSLHPSGEERVCTNNGPRPHDDGTAITAVDQSHTEVGPRCLVGATESSSSSAPESNTGDSAERRSTLRGTSETDGCCDNVFVHCGVEVRRPATHVPDENVEVRREDDCESRLANLQIGQVRQAILCEDDLCPDSPDLGRHSPTPAMSPRVLGPPARGEVNLPPVISAQLSARGGHHPGSEVSRPGDSVADRTQHLMRSKGDQALHGAGSKYDRSDGSGENGTISCAASVQESDCAEVVLQLRQLWSTLPADTLQTVEFATTHGSSDSNNKLLCFVDGQPIFFHTRRVSCHLPLGKIVPPSFDFHELGRLFDEVPPSKDMRYVFDIFTTDIVARHLEENQSTRENRTLTKAVCREPEIFRMLDPLCEQGTLSMQTQTGTNTFTMPAFLVPKSTGIASRLIIDCRSLNECLENFYMPRMALPDIGEIMDTALHYQFAATRDASSMFYQFAVPASLAHRMQIRVEWTTAAIVQIFLPLAHGGLGLFPCSLSAIFYEYAERRFVSCSKCDRLSKVLEGALEGYVAMLPYREESLLALKDSHWWLGSAWHSALDVSSICVCFGATLDCSGGASE